jgi:uncharacterized protein (DUF1778 family)
MKTKNQKPETTPRGVIHIRVSEAERAPIQAAADADERTLSDWARLALLRAARGDKK